MIQKRGNRWRVVVQASRDPLTGARRQLSGSAATERDAVRLERQLRRQAGAGAVGRTTFSRRAGDLGGSGTGLVSHRTSTFTGCVTR